MVPVVEQSRPTISIWKQVSIQIFNTISNNGWTGKIPDLSELL